MLSGKGQVILGTWPLSGITSVGISPQSSRDTILAALDTGVVAFDTAYSYGYEGECDRLLGDILRDWRSEMVVIGKVGQRWGPDRQRLVDGRPQVLISDALESLSRLGITAFDLLMLHQPDPNVDVRQSAEALADLRERGVCKAVGVCNVDLVQLETFCEVLKPAAIQTPLNILQRESLRSLIPWCVEHGILVHVYWALMKGILAGRIGRDFQFDEKDSRPKYPVYQGEYRERTHRLIEKLREIGAQNGISVAQLTIGWALSQPGVSGVLVGAKRPAQVIETSKSRPLGVSLLQRVEEAVVESIDPTA